MGAGTFSKERRIPQNFYNVHTGLGIFTRKVAEEVEGSIPRQNKNGDTIHEIQVEYIVGKLVQLTRRNDGNFGVEFIFGIYDDVENAISSISFGFTNYLTRSVFNQVCNLKPEDIQEKFIVFYIYQRPDKEKKDEMRTWLQVSVVPDIDEAISGGPEYLYEHRLGLRYPKDELPGPTFVRDGGKEKKSFDDQMEFLWAKAEECVVPHVKNVIDLSKATGTPEGESSKNLVRATGNEEADEDDDFPF